jgi:hypothetical protein
MWTWAKRQFEHFTFTPQRLPRANHQRFPSRRHGRRANYDRANTPLLRIPAGNVTLLINRHRLR